jgi:DNA-binding GntR family transcriptional regulator
VPQTPVREALACLESHGLVAKEPLRSYGATSTLNRKQLDAPLHQFTHLIEPWGARLAAERVIDIRKTAIMDALAACPRDKWMRLRNFKDAFGAR